MRNENSLDGAVARGAKGAGLSRSFSAHSCREDCENEVCGETFNGILGWVTRKGLDLDGKSLDDAANDAGAVFEGEHSAVMHVNPKSCSISCGDERN